MSRRVVSCTVQEYVRSADVSRMLHSAYAAVLAGSTNSNGLGSTVDLRSPVDRLRQPSSRGMRRSKKLPQRRTAAAARCGGGRRKRRVSYPGSCCWTCGVCAAWTGPRPAGSARSPIRWLACRRAQHRAHAVACHDARGVTLSQISSHVGKWASNMWASSSVKP